MTRYWVSTAVAAVLAGSVPLAAATTIVGVVSGVSEGALEVTPRHGRAYVAHLDSRTRYTRWVTHQPWQQDRVADRRRLKAGRCVAVELGRDGGRASVVRISLDAIGTVYSPCR